MKNFLIPIIVLFTQISIAAEVIELPEEELAKETVLPRFDNAVTVKNKNIITLNKIETSVYFGWNFTEPIYNQSKMGMNVGYHWSEDSAFMLNFAKWSGGLNTQYTDQLYSQYKLDFSRAPKPEYSIYGNYELKAYYGKISLTKQGVMNLHLYPILGAGITKFQHKNYFGANVGVGWKFYFSKNWSLRTDLKFQFSQSPSPFLKDKMKTTDGVPLPSEFQDKWTYSTIFDLGVSAIF
ncbi:MAG: hypothetical protein BroJett040_17630 [Oligoflexia bacterium]|nr:MAG: hypothetical protein BroJett040_17630 [Oligoflexia bacterium]